MTALMQTIVKLWVGNPRKYNRKNPICLHNSEIFILQIFLHIQYALAHLQDLILTLVGMFSYAFYSYHPK